MTGYNIGIRIETIVHTDGDPGDIAFDLRKALTASAESVAGQGATGEVESFIAHEYDDPFEATYVEPRKDAYLAGIARVGEVASLDNAHKRMPIGYKRDFWYAAILSVTGSYFGRENRFAIPDVFWADVDQTYKCMMDAGRGERA